MNVIFPKYDSYQFLIVIIGHRTSLVSVKYFCHGNTECQTSPHAIITFSLLKLPADFWKRTYVII